MRQVNCDSIKRIFIKLKFNINSQARIVKLLSCFYSKRGRDLMLYPCQISAVKKLRLATRVRGLPLW
jgi:hypothetical protein